MSGSGSRHTRAAWAAALVFAAGGGALAAEKEDKIVPITQPREDTAISATRREFETIKSSRDPALQQKADIPRLGVPEMPASSAGPSWSPPKPNVQEKKSANWLLDAMEKQAAERKGATRDRDRSEREAERKHDGFARDTLDGTNERSSLRENVDSNPVHEGDRKLPATPMINPLSRYLGEWMTPQDYSLLKPGLMQSTGPSPVANRDPATAGAVQAPGTTLPVMDGLSRAKSGAPSAMSQGKPPENPFLQSLNARPVAPVQPIGAAPSPVVTSASAAAPIVAQPVPANEPAKSKVPEFARPAQDEKYFKQLKRF